MRKRLPRIIRLPEPLPAGEEILWRGAPRKWSLAVRVFLIREIAVYFAVILAWRGVVSYLEDQSILAAVITVLWLLPLALVALGLLGLFAYLIGRTTSYTITSRRLVMQFGVAFPMTLNIPFKLITSAALRAYPDGTGDIPISTTGKDKIAYFVLWPHARPWHFKRPEPMLRVVPDAERVAGILSRALVAETQAAAPPSEEAKPTDEAAPEAPEASSQPFKAA